MQRLAVALAFLSSFAVAAPPKSAFSGAIGDPSLRRKVELVYVERVDAVFAPPAEPAVMNQAKNVYVPRLLPVVVGTKVQFKSEDSELHNVFGRGDKKVLFNQGVPPHATAERAMTEPGIVKLSCNIHREMTAFIPVLQNPFWSQPDAKTGTFTIQGLPPGTYELRMWGEKLSDEEKAKKYPVTVGAPQTAPLTLAARGNQP